MSSIKTLNPKAEVMSRVAALFMTINAAKGLRDVMATNLGPAGTIKMLVDGSGGEQGERGRGGEGGRGRGACAQIGGGSASEGERGKIGARFGRPRRASYPRPPGGACPPRAGRCDGGPPPARGGLVLGVEGRAKRGRAFLRPGHCAPRSLARVFLSAPPPPPLSTSPPLLAPPRPSLARAGIKLTKDGNVLLREMQIQNPTAVMIARAAVAQDDITG